MLQQAVVKQVVVSGFLLRWISVCKPSQQTEIGQGFWSSVLHRVV